MSVLRKAGETMNIGDVVRLKSGGPKMVVVKIDDDDGRLTCRWFSDEEAISVSTDYFYPDTVDKIESSTYRSGLF